MELNIQAFGIAKEIVGGSEVQLQVNEKITAAELKKLLERRYQELSKLSSFLLAVNDEYAEPEAVVKAGDEIAIIPPVSGG
jgi:molybdopterin converting factor subunit 1